MLKMMFLDDSQRRIKEFKKTAKNKLKTTNVVIAKSAKDAIKLLKKHKDFEWIFLDHDLGLPTDGRKTESKYYDQENCGMNVVNWMINNNYPKKDLMIIVHSWNIERGQLMSERLRQYGYISKYQPGAWNNLG